MSIFLPLVDFFQQHAFLWDSLKFMAAGMFFDLTRRWSSSILDIVMESATVTAVISSGDPAQDWVNHYIQKHIPDLDRTPPLWADVLESFTPTGKVAPRRLEVTTSRPWSDAVKDSRDRWWMPRGVKQDGSEDIYTQRTLEDRRQAFTYRGKTIYYRATKTHSWQDEFTMELSTFGRSRTIFSSLVHEARMAFLSTSDAHLSVYEPNSGPRDYRGNWKLTSSRPNRPWESIILPEGIKEDLLVDVKEFVSEKLFYREKGVPFRRGWLLYGVPGSGKSSLISAIACELNFNIYVISLGASDMDDSRLQSLFRGVPERCMVVLEDLDCANASRSKPESTDKKEGDAPDTASKEEKKPASGSDKPVKGVTLSGLLNAIDGIASAEGRLLFCTTNHLESIDPALVRPGRCDVQVEFKNATKSQVGRLFRHFYTGTPSPPPAIELDESITVDGQYPLTPLPTPAPTPTSTGGADEKAMEHLAEAFERAIPADSVSASAIQGFLMKYKRRPEAAVGVVQAWVEGGFASGPATAFKVREGKGEDENGKKEVNGSLEVKVRFTGYEIELWIETDLCTYTSTRTDTILTNIMRES